MNPPRAPLSLASVASPHRTPEPIARPRAGTERPPPGQEPLPGPEADGRRRQDQGLGRHVGHRPPGVHPVERVGHQQEGREQADPPVEPPASPGRRSPGSRPPPGGPTGIARDRQGPVRDEPAAGVRVPRPHRRRAGPAIAPGPERARRSGISGGGVNHTPRKSSQAGSSHSPAEPEVGEERLGNIGGLVHEVGF